MAEGTEAPSRAAESQRGDVISLLLGTVPGIVVGAYTAGLLFFLNPELAQTPPAVLRATALYAGLFGVLSSLCSLLVAGRSTERARSLLPWSLSAALMLCAITTWAHAAAFAYYLPPGINVRLVKAAVTLSIAALIAGLTALLHSIDRRPYGVRSRLLLALLSAAVLYVMVERRAAFDPPPPVAPLASETSYRNRPDLWVIGLDGATLDAVLPLVEQGQLPFFARLLANGISARVNSLPRVTPPALWTTIATGRHPYQHRVVGDLVYPAGILSPGESLRLVPPGYRWWGFHGAQAKPLDADQRRSSTLWEVASRLDIPSGVLGWPATHPAREPLAFAFSERYFDGDLRRATTRPAELAERGILFRLEPGAIETTVTEPLGEPLSFPLLQALADDLWRESLTSFLLDQQPEVDALFVRLQGLAAVSSRYYGGFASVQFDGVQDAERQEAARSIAAYYRHLDLFLSALMARPGEPRLLAVVSARGFHQLSGWRRLTALSPSRSLAGSASGGADGLLLLSGPGIKAGERLADIELVDILPTLLYGVGLPIARDLDGRVLTAAFESTFLARQQLSFVPSYETLGLKAALPPGPELMAPPAATDD